MTLTVQHLLISVLVRELADMKYTGKPLTEERRHLLWQLWHEGKSLQEIARHLDIQRPSVFIYLQKRGGIEPAARTRSSIVLRKEEREEISRGLRAGLSLRQIARDLGRSPSTITREVRRHGGPRKYRATVADNRAWRQARP